MNYYIGLDNGGTTTKAGLFDQYGREICVSSTDTNVIIPYPGYTERDMEEMWQANIKVIRDILQKSGIDPIHIKGLAVCGHGKGLYLWGKDGKPAYNGIISTDTRATEIVKKWQMEKIEEKTFPISCQHIMACQPVALLAWLKENDPEVINNIRWIFEAKDYIRFRLTGEARAEMTDYSGTNLMNLTNRSFDWALLKLFGIPEIWDCIPPLCKSYEICGYITAETAKLTGLIEGTPVAGGMFDIDACAISADITNEKNICVIAGTWSINEYIRKTPVMDGSVLMNSLFCLPEYYLIEESSATSAGNFEWFIRNLLPELKEKAKNEDIDFYGLLNNAVASVSPDDFTPVFLPFLLSSNVNPDAKACFLGLSSYHTRAHLIRSVYEGVVFSHRFHIEKLLSSFTDFSGHIRLSGGAARSAVWSQMFADILKIPVDVVDANETGALGCAIAAAAAAGDYKSIEEAAAAMSSIRETLFPNEDNFQIYDKKYELYLKSIETLDTLWKDIKLMIETCSSRV